MSQSSTFVRPSTAMSREVRAHAEMLEELREQLLPHLPAELLPHCQLANFRNSTLIFLADDSLWATRLRQLSGAILHAALTFGKVEARRVEVKISPTNAPRKAAEPAPRELSETARAQLDRAADSADPALARTMRKMARKP